MNRLLPAVDPTYEPKRYELLANNVLIWAADKILRERPDYYPEELFDETNFYATPLFIAIGLQILIEELLANRPGSEVASPGMSPAPRHDGDIVENAVPVTKGKGSRRKKGFWAKDTEPPADSQFDKSIDETLNLRDLAYCLERRPEWIRDNNGKKIWVQGLSATEYKVWFNSRAMYLKAIERKPSQRKDGEGRLKTPKDKTFAKPARKRPHSS